MTPVEKEIPLDLLETIISGSILKFGHVFGRYWYCYLFDGELVQHMHLSGKVWPYFRLAEMCFVVRRGGLNK